MGITDYYCSFKTETGDSERKLTEFFFMVIMSRAEIDSLDSLVESVEKCSKQHLY